MNGHLAKRDVKTWTVQFKRISLEIQLEIKAAGKIILEFSQKDI